MDEEALRDIVEPIVRSRLAGFGYKDLSVRTGEDHDGDAVLFIDIDFDSGSRVLGGELTLGIIGEIRTALAQSGDGRFPHLRWHDRSGEYPEDDERDLALFTEASAHL